MTELLQRMTAPSGEFTKYAKFMKCTDKAGARWYDNEEVNPYESCPLYLESEIASAIARNTGITAK